MPINTLCVVLRHAKFDTSPYKTSQDQQSVFTQHVLRASLAISSKNQVSQYVW